MPGKEKIQELSGLHACQEKYNNYLDYMFVREYPIIKHVVKIILVSIQSYSGSSQCGAFMIRPRRIIVDSFDLSFSFTLETYLVHWIIEMDGQR